VVALASATIPFRKGSVGILVEKAKGVII